MFPMLAQHVTEIVFRLDPVKINDLATIPLLTPLIDPNWINSELAIALVKIF